MKKYLSFLLIAILIFMLTGCWNRRELGELGIVGAVALDNVGVQIRETYELITPKTKESKSGDEPPVSYLQSEGKTIFDANRNATLKYYKKLFWPHINMIYFSTEFSKNGLFNYIDYFNRNHESRRFVNLAVVDGSPAYEIISVTGIKDEIPSNYVEKLFENYSANGKSVSIKLSEFLKTYYTEGIEPVVGIIRKDKKVETMPEKTQNDEKEKKEENSAPSIEGLAVFKGDKLVGFFNGAEARGYNFIVGKIKSCVIVSASPDGFGKNSMEIISASSDLKVKVKDNQYYATIKVKANGMLDGESGKEDITNSESINIIQENTSKVIKNEIQEALKKAKEYSSDIFGFGECIHISNPEKWMQIKDNWNNEFPSLNVDVDVETSMQRSGVANRQLLYKEGR